MENYALSYGERSFRSSTLGTRHLHFTSEVKVQEVIQEPVKEVVKEVEQEAVKEVVKEVEQEAVKEVVKEVEPVKEEDGKINQEANREHEIVKETPSLESNPNQVDNDVSPPAPKGQGEGGDKETESPKEEETT